MKKMSKLIFYSYFNKPVEQKCLGLSLNRFQVISREEFLKKNPKYVYLVFVEVSEGIPRRSLKATVSYCTSISLEFPVAMRISRTVFL